MNELINQCVWNMAAMILTGKDWITGRKMCLPICPPQIPYGLIWDET